MLTQKRRLVMILSSKRNIERKDNMTTAIIEKILATKGQFVSLNMKREVKVKRGQPQFFKETSCVVRMGVGYDNLALVKELRANNELPTENAGLSGMEWEVYPFILKSIKTGERQVRCTISKNHVSKVTFTDANGLVVSRDVVKDAAYASEFAVKDTTQEIVFNCKLSNVVSIGNVVA
jgi:hypothetical protein